MFGSQPTITGSAVAHRYIRSMLTGTVLGALLCIGIAASTVYYEAVTPSSAEPFAHTAATAETQQFVNKTATPSTASNQNSGATITTKPITNTANVVPACTPDTVDQSLSAIDLTGANDGLTQTIDADHTYQIYGNNDTQIRQQINTCAPKLSGDADEFTAYTSYRLSWQYGYIDDGTGQCQVVHAKVGMHIAKVVPSWTVGAAANTSFIKQWQTFMTNLETHEQGHVVINEQYANQILASMQNFPLTSCDSIANAITTSINGQIAQLDAKQAAYDDSTNHGATQGAILP